LVVLISKMPAATKSVWERFIGSINTDGRRRRNSLGIAQAKGPYMVIVDSGETHYFGVGTEGAKLSGDRTEGRRKKIALIFFRRPFFIARLFLFGATVWEQI